MSDNDLIALPRGPRPGDRFEAEVKGLTGRGDGTARLSLLVGPQRERRDYTLIIPRAVPGDRVEATVLRRRRDRLEAHVTGLLRASAARVAPRCPHFEPADGRTRGCGGCALQTLAHDAQLEAKEQRVRGLIAGAGLDAERVRPVLGCEAPWFYRNKMEFSVGDDGQGRFALGFHPAGYRHDVLRLDACYLASPFVRDLLPALRARLEAAGLRPFSFRGAEGWLRTLTVREGKRTGERLIEWTTSAHDVAWLDGAERPADEVARWLSEATLSVAAALGAEVTSLYWTQHDARAGQRTQLISRLLHGAPVVHEALLLPGGHRLDFEVHPRAFFQPNTVQAERLYAEVLESARLLDPADPQRPRCALDLYCGTGTIALCLAPYAERVLGIELQPDAVDNARRNAAHNGIDNATFFAGDVAEVLAGEAFVEAAGEGGVGLVVVDPPRAGLSPQARAQVAALAAPRVVYVSCNPETLARDLAALVGDGYALERLQPVDMFPHTWHVESVALLTRRP